MLALLTLLGCGKSDSSDESVAVDEDTASLQLVLSEATPDQTLEIAAKSIETVDEGLESSAGSLVFNLTAESEPASKWCTNHGDPLAEPADFPSLTEDNGTDPDQNDDGTIKRTHPNFAARSFHCKLKIDSVSPDTVRGTFSLVKAILCALKDQVDFTSEDEADAIFTFTEACFPPKMLEGDLAGKTATTKLISTTNTGNEWEKKLAFGPFTIGSETMTRNGDK